MTDLRQRFEEIEDVPVPDLWDRITEVAATEAVAPVQPRSRALVAVAAAVLALLLIGGPLLVLGSSDSVESVEEPVTTTAPAVTTTAPVVATAIGAEAFRDGEWLQVAAGQPWVESIIDVEALPGGGFVAVAVDPWTVVWSPDGAEWIDGDPQGHMALYEPDFSGDAFSRDPRARVVAAAGDQIVILDRVNTGVWVGDPRSGEWEEIRFDDADLDGDANLITVAGNAEQALVVAQEGAATPLEIDDDGETVSIPLVDRYLAWVVDPSSATATRYALPMGGERGAGDAMVVADWFGEQWVAAILVNVWLGSGEGWGMSVALATSPDGLEWTAIGAPEDFDSMTSMTAGPESIIVTVCHFGGDSFWHSDDGLNWSQTTNEYLGHGSTYVDGVGFVIVTGDDSRGPLVSVDGSTWESAETGSPVQGAEFLVGSGGDLLVVQGFRDGVPSSEMWLWENR